MSVQQHIALALRKERLLMLASRQRDQLAEYGGVLERPCAMADKVIDAGHYARAHPWTTGLAVAAAVLVGRRHLLRVAGYAWSGWRAWRFVGGWAREAGLLNRVKRP
jgi:hypothetical protein